jgi:hypothetical protein
MQWLLAVYSWHLVYFPLLFHLATPAASHPTGVQALSRWSLLVQVPVKPFSPPHSLSRLACSPLSFTAALLLCCCDHAVTATFFFSPVLLLRLHTATIAIQGAFFISMIGVICLTPVKKRGIFW